MIGASPDDQILMGRDHVAMFLPELTHDVHIGAGHSTTSTIYHDRRRSSHRKSATMARLPLPGLAETVRRNNQTELQVGWPPYIGVVSGAIHQTGRPRLLHLPTSRTVFSYFHSTIGRRSRFLLDPSCLASEYLDFRCTIRRVKKLILDSSPLTLPFYRTERPRVV
jgi:hypothetical protein